VSKGEETRAQILERAALLARTTGLSGLSIGRLAEELALSKSGLFAHFGSKEALEVEVLKEARRQFVEGVVVPALKEKRGEPRVRALFERWVEWAARQGGCLMTAASAELDDKTGPVRDEVEAAQRDWLGTLAHAARIAKDERHFRAALDVDQFAFEAEGIALMYHLALRLLRDPLAGKRAHRAFTALVERSRAPRQ
jgi:AcrR family transcriptional regulator